MFCAFVQIYMDLTLYYSQSGKPGYVPSQSKVWTRHGAKTNDNAGLHEVAVATFWSIVVHADFPDFHILATTGSLLEKVCVCPCV